MSSVHPKNVLSSLAKCSTNNRKVHIKIIQSDKDIEYATVQYTTKNSAEVAQKYYNKIKQFLTKPFLVYTENDT